MSFFTLDRARHGHENPGQSIQVGRMCKGGGQQSERTRLACWVSPSPSNGNLDQIPVQKRLYDLGASEIRVLTNSNIKSRHTVSKYHHAFTTHFFFPGKKNLIVDDPQGDEASMASFVLVAAAAAPLSLYYLQSSFDIQFFQLKLNSFFYFLFDHALKKKIRKQVCVCV